ncbi:MAG: hypothetical protein WC989_04370 [Micavibrio sp.]
MDLKDIQEKLQALRDRIKEDGHISPESERALQDLLSTSLISTNEELSAAQARLNAAMAVRAGNDNALSDDQKKRLRLMEKTGTGSYAVH